MRGLFEGPVVYLFGEVPRCSLVSFDRLKKPSVMPKSLTVLPCQNLPLIFAASTVVILLVIRIGNGIALATSFLSGGFAAM